MNRARLIIVARCLILAVALWLGDDGVWLVPLALLPSVLPTGAKIYVGNFSPTRHVVPSATDWSSSTANGYASSGVHCFDPITETLYFGENSQITTAIESNFSTVATVVSTGNVVAIDCDPTNQRLFYTTQSGGSFDLRKVNYDGTGDTSLKTWSGVTTNNGNDLKYDLTSDTIYYSKLNAGTTVAEIRSILSDGTGDTLIRTWTTNSVGITKIAIDFTNRLLFWGECTSVSFGATTTTYKSADMSGGSLATIYTVAGTVETDCPIAFSQSQSKLYIAETNANKITMRNGDGTGAANVIASGAAAIFGTLANSKIALGDGAETVGAGAIL